MALHEEPDSNSENQPSFESPSFLAAAKKAIKHGIDALKLEEKPQMGIPAVGDADVDEGKGFQYPIRPSEPDCMFYLRTGCCKFGAHCRFNHPREERAVQDRNRISTKEFQTIKERDKGFPKVVDRCKFHSMPGGCRFGEACRYSHEIAESVPVELNGLGLPIRKGERVCSYYMRTGTCKYYSSCKFHHPELSDVAGLHVFGCHSANFLQTTSWPLHFSLISQTLPTASIDSSSNLDILQSYMPATPSEWLNLYKDQTICEDSNLPSLSKSTNCHPSAADQNGFSKLEDSPLQLKKEVIYNRKESGESQSQNGIRSEGFRLVPPWWPIHLKCHLSESEGCLLSPLGLPQRPDQPVCIYYSRFGICKYGPACKFDHPADENTEQSITIPAEEKMEGEGSLLLQTT